jgi:ribonuclease J
VADCVALAIKTGIGTIIHTGDFKLDPTPIDGHRVDLAAFARCGEQGVTALLSDSTNVERGGYTSSESEVGKALSEVISESPARVIVAMFASNVHRIQQVLDAASEHGRKVALLGRSMEANTRIAKELGHLEIPKGVVVEPEKIKTLPDHQVVLLTTGTQGEPLSGLSRMARGEHKQVSIRPGDTVVMSSRFIPGNERAIDFLINEFYRRGAEVIYEKVSDIHVSGHASREELKLMISLTKPHYFMPIHGEYRQLVKHGQLAAEMGIPKERILIAEDGDVVIFDEIGGERKGMIEAGKQVVDGTRIADSDDVVLQERSRLAREGVLIAVAHMDMQDGKLIRPLELKSIGFLYEEESGQELEAARIYAEQEISSLPDNKRKDKDALDQSLRAALKRHIKKSLFRFPVIIPVIIDS